MASHAKTLQSAYPWTTSPFIVSAPMRLTANDALALTVSRTHGLGFLGIGNVLSALPPFLEKVTASLAESPIPNTPSDILPVGVGFICFGIDLAAALATLSSAPVKPAAAWLFAPKEMKDFADWSRGIRDATAGKTKIWIQVGNLATALEAARTCRPDVLVIQGIDAGGHGLEHASSIITLLPECADALSKAGFGDIPLVAAGGIADGRGVAAATMLGAAGVCMGTRFLCSPEAAITNGYRDVVLKAKDGDTSRTKLWDRLMGNWWPEEFDGRGVLNDSVWDDEKGLPEEENKKLYGEAAKSADGWAGEKTRMCAYAGSGVGLINEIKPAVEIVKEVTRDAKRFWKEDSSTSSLNAKGQQSDI
ncbi:Nitronate monooxygenase [Lachnellula hyalina]|uniref:Nitronate monooxygenase n=1 Tax=Lachnellula hyalina TaxID=1316788 RepID=A0A8H8U1R9_9HELO|nr:Nitronate monooxygenase [Lachnellula hyalina]TVY28600.1 Nitronate monooxygenase [Lachnellula hyalina]